MQNVRDVQGGSAPDCTDVRTLHEGDGCCEKIDEGARRSIKVSPKKEIINRPDGTLWLLQTASRSW